MCVCAHVNRKQASTHSQVVEILRPEPGKDAGLDGVARGVEEGLGNLVPLPVHLGLLVDVHAHQVLVDPQKVDDRVVLMHKDVGDPWDLRKKSKYQSRAREKKI